MPVWMRHLMAVAALALGAFLGHRSLALPAPALAGAEGFSAARVLADLREIARAPHSVLDVEAHAAVREHIRNRLAGLGLAVAEMDYPEAEYGRGNRFPLHNLAAGIPGRSGSSVLIVSHYDSALPIRGQNSGISRGAADDGYGVATALEIAGLLARSKEPLQNGVRFLFTDGEEIALCGARQEMERNLAAYSDVNLVINLEARGIKGPVLMFETGPDNLATLDLYRRAGRPCAYSFAVDVYRRMPNGTDFTEFVRKGFPGLNFAVLDDLSYYHTARDNPDNVDLRSLQHYRDQILPLVKAYAAEARFGPKEAFASREDAVYFSWLPGTFFCWPKRYDVILNWGTTLGCLAYAVWLFAQGRAKVGPSFRWFLLWAGLALGALGLGTGVSALASLLTGIPWRLTWMPNVPLERPVTWALLLGVAVAAYGLAARSARRGRSGFAPILGALGLNLALLAVVSLLLPGGTFLFSLPILATLAALLLAHLMRFQPLVLAAPALIVSLFVPILHLIGLGLTFGALGAVLMLAAFPLALAGAVLGGVGAEA